jgi:hypothetical protein
MTKLLAQVDDRDHKCVDDDEPLCKDSFTGEAMPVHQPSVVFEFAGAPWTGTVKVPKGRLVLGGHQVEGTGIFEVVSVHVRQGLDSDAERSVRLRLIDNQRWFRAGLPGFERERIAPFRKYDACLRGAVSRSRIVVVALKLRGLKLEATEVDGSRRASSDYPAVVIEFPR